MLKAYPIHPDTYRWLRKRYKNTETGKSYTQSEMAQKLGVSPGMYKRYELGTSIPSEQIHLEMCYVWDVRLYYSTKKVHPLLIEEFLEKRKQDSVRD